MENINLVGLINDNNKKSKNRLLINHNDYKSVNETSGNVSWGKKTQMSM